MKAQEVNRVETMFLQAWPKQPKGGPKLMLELSNLSSRNDLTNRFRNAWKMGVQGIIESGKVLVEGKEQLEHGQFQDWLKDDLALAPRKAQMLMLIAKHPVLANAKNFFAFPACWYSLYLLSHLCRPGQDPAAMLQAIETGQINPFMTVADVQALLSGRKQEASSLILSAELARMQRQFSKLRLSEAVANLRDDPGDSNPESLLQFAQQLTEVASHWQATAD